MEPSVAVFLLVVSASLAQEDLEGKMFVFPKETDTAHVILRPTITEPLQEVSGCLRSYSELSRQYSLFSLATPKYKDAFLIRFQAPSTYTVSINNGSSVFRRDSEPADWSHTCVTLDSKTGVVNLWANGKISTRGFTRREDSIEAETNIVLGQEQDSSGGGFDTSRALVGEISDVHMWDYVLTPEDIQKVLSGDLHGNVINWKSLLYEMKGDVLLQPKNLHMEGKIFVFPRETKPSHVLLKSTITEPLQKASVCLRSYSDLSHPYTPFSIATPGAEKAFVVSIQPPHTCSVYINQEVTHFQTDSESLRHTCVTWDSDTGVVQLWVNGKLYPEGVSMKGSSIAAEASIVLGQKQNSFNASQSLVGEISDVHMWDYVLTPEDIKKVLSGDLHGNVINWLSLHYEIKGDVLVQSKHQNLEGKVFVFPKATDTDHVILRPTITRPLRKATVCLRSYSELSRPYTLFSIATPRYADAFFIYFEPPYTYKVFINSVGAAFSPKWKSFYWRHICVTWDSSYEGAYLWLNGKISSERGSIRQNNNYAYHIDAESSIVLGQDQDSFGGGFDAFQSLVGEISDVHMWDYVLTAEDIQKVLSGDLHGNVINWKSLRFEIKGEVLVTPKPHHLEGKVFVFPKETDTDHVILRPTITRPLQEVTVCLRSYTDLSRPYTPFSLATPEKDNAFLIYLQPPNTCSVYINQEVTNFKTDVEFLNWRHICVTWDSDTGVVQLWVNGKLYPRKVSMKGSSIAAENSIVLGQEQDSFGGKFDEKQSLVGEISDVHMWDYVLTQEDIQKVLSGDLHGNVINWKSLRCEIKGEVHVKPEPQRLEDKVFVFPKETNTTHVILRPTITEPLQKVSVCLRSYTDLSRPYALFSLATPGKDSAFVIYFQPPNTCSVYINQELTSFRTDSESLAWRHICVTWDSETGVVQLWVNGKLYPRRVSMKGSSIAAETSIVLGQEQDSFGGKFDEKQSLVGEISDVHMWDYVLTSEDFIKVIYGRHNGNVINWISLYSEIKGEVLVQPKFP
ncbi:uncharacterized protein LOC120933773 [Rana temporaria]|uniref:uncharacterized protein LOC120933773 n=1 Tax=Rana temporaria TaxID=8407 RepID=UPI001AAD9F24|nr:uncharacterized protein LOC120933773 [Rana temporaria]